MDWERALKLLAMMAIISVSFFAGVTFERALKNAEIAQLKQAYAEANQAEQKRIVEEFNEKQVELEKALSDARARESDANADTERMRQQLSEMSRAAKTAESKQSIRFAKLAVRSKKLLDRASTALEFCDKALQ